MKAKRFLKVFVTSLVCLALVFPVMQVASADPEPGAAIDSTTNPELYNALVEYGSPRAFDVDEDGSITVSELQNYDNGSHQMNLDGDYLATQHGRLTSVEGLQYLTHITRLELQHNLITDVTPLADISALTFLDLSYNRLRDLDPFAGHLPALSYFDFGHNSVPSIYGLQDNASLTYLHFAVNQVTDLRPLVSMSSLGSCTVSWNALNPGSLGNSTYWDVKTALTSVAFTDAGQNTYNVSYIANGSTTRVSDTGLRYGDELTAPVASRPGETYMGWDWNGDGAVDFSPGSGAFTPPVSALAPSDTHSYDLEWTAVYASPNAELGNPGNNRGTIVFFPADSHYDITLEPWDRNVTLHPSLMEPHATYTIDGASVVSRTFNCNPGVPVTVTIVVTAQDRINSNTYTVDILRTRPQLGKLAGFVYDHGTLDPAFQPLTRRYTLTLDEFTDRVTITPEKGYDVDRVSPASRTVVLRHKGDSKTVTFTVRSGVDRRYSTTYYVKVVRSKSAIAALSSLKVTPPGGVVSGFDPLYYGPYTVTIPWTRSSVRISAKALESGSTVYMGFDTDLTLRRATSRTFTLRHPGDVKNVIVRVLSPDRSVSREYIVKLMRDPAPTDATLSAVRVNGLAVSGFAPSTFDYTVTAPSNRSYATIKVYTGESHATVKIDGHRTKSFTVRGLVAGVPKRVTIEVTAADGVTVLTYHVDITRALPSI